MKKIILIEIQKMEKLKMNYLMKIEDFCGLSGVKRTSQKNGLDLNSSTRK